MKTKILRPLKLIKSIKLSIFILLIFYSVNVYSQHSNYNAGTLRCNIDGDTLTFTLISTQTPDYFDVLTAYGSADKGVMRIVWDKVKSPSEIKAQSIDLEGYTNKSPRTFELDVIWADFLINTPYVIKKGKLSITETMEA